MLYLSVILFVISAVLGITVLVKWLSKENASKTIVYAHGIAAALALTILIAFAVQHPESFPQTSIVLFVLAALGGFYLFYRDFNGKPRLIPVALIHGGLAAGGLLTLLFFMFS